MRTSYFEEEIKKGICCYLKDLSNNNPYYDLDGIQGNGYKYNCEDLYKELWKYLNKKKKNVELKNKFEFSFDSKSKFPGILVKEGKEAVFCLKSDQLAFSFSREAAYDSKYACGKYFQMAKSKSKAAEFMAEYIYATRSLGCSFLWPIPKDATGVLLNPKYNTVRGVSSYIEDSVDLTLWEIKEYYDRRKDPKTNVEGSILRSVLLSDEERRTGIMQKWLDGIGSFENYVNLFCFNDFLDEDGVPLDLVESDIKNGKKVPLKSNDVVSLRQDGSKKRIQNEITKYEDMSRLLENVKELVQKRSESMLNK